MAQQVLRNFIDAQTRKISIDSIQKAVAEQFGMRVPEIKPRTIRERSWFAADRYVPGQTVDRMFVA